MALGTFIAGRYSATNNSVDVGITKDGYRLEQGSEAELLNETDAFGATLIDWVYRGGSVRLNFRSKEYKAGSLACFWPWGALGVLQTTSAPISRLASDVAVAFVLSSTANTPAAAAPASLTATKAILAPNVPAEILFDSRLREVPISLQLLPYVSSSSHIFFALT